MDQVTDKFGDWIKEGFDLYKNNLGMLVVAFLIALILSIVTGGILLGPMSAGLIVIVLKLIREEPPPPEIGEVFNGFQFFLPSFLFVLVWGLLSAIIIMILMVIPCVGPLLNLAFFLLVGTNLMFALFLIVDQKMDFWTASKTSFTLVQPSFFPFLGLFFVAGILGQIGSVACGVGIVLTMPLYYTILGVAYRDVFAASENTVQKKIHDRP